MSSAPTWTTEQSARAPRTGGRAPLRVVVLAGGPSAEHDISLSSAACIADGLRAGGHDVLAVTITKDSKWLFEGTPLALEPGSGLLGADVAFPALHGPFGEDGTLQGVLEALGIAYVGAPVDASAICMNKVVFKDLMSVAQVPQVAYARVRRARWEDEPELVLRELRELAPPVFVKPARMGSSLGIARVSEPAQMHAALALAFALDDLLIVEAAAPGIEIECAVLGGRENAVASPAGQIVVPGDWYDFAAKYSPGGMRLEVPAPISATATQLVQTLALSVFHMVGCEDLARVDFFVDGERVLVNELNTMPGFTPTSVFPKLVQQNGIGYSELVQRLCHAAIARHRPRASAR